MIRLKRIDLNRMSAQQQGSAISLTIADRAEAPSRIKKYRIILRTIHLKDTTNLAV